MTEEQIEQMAEEYSEAFIAKGVAKASYIKGYQDGAEPREKRIVELEKQLTKAKEIIKKLLEEEKDNMYWEMNGSDKSSYYEVRKQAEQFISDSKQEE